MAAYTHPNYISACIQRSCKIPTTEHVFKVQDLNDAVIYIVQCQRTLEIQNGAL